MRKILLAVVSFFSVSTILISSSCTAEVKTPIADSLVIGMWTADGLELELDTSKHDVLYHEIHDNVVNEARYDLHLHGVWRTGVDSLVLDFSDSHGNASWTGYQNDEEQEQVGEMARKGQEELTKKLEKEPIVITDVKISGDTLTGKTVVDGKATEVTYIKKS